MYDIEENYLDIYLPKPRIAAPAIERNTLPLDLSVFVTEIEGIIMSKYIYS